MGLLIDRAKYFEKIGYSPHTQQWRYHNNTARFRVAACGRRFGKTTMVARDMEMRLFKPDTLHWIVGREYDEGEKEFRYIWNDLIVGQKLGQDKRVKKSYNTRQGEMYIQMPWGTRLEVKSAKYPDTLVGEGLDSVIVAEAAKHRASTFQRFLRPALSDKRGVADFASTPEGHNWFYDLYKLGLNPDNDEYASFHFPSWENRAVYPGGRQDPEILSLEMAMDKDLFSQEIAADFASFAGRIYAEFDENTHIRTCKYNPAWPNYIAFDWGFVHPLAAIEFQVDPWDNITIWREHYKSYMQLRDHIDEMNAREQPPGYKIDCCFGDAADPEAAATVSQYLAPCIVDPDAKVNWRQGVDNLKRFLKRYDTGRTTDEYGTPELLPMLFVDWSCPNTIREFINYKGPDEDRNQPESNAAGPVKRMGQEDNALDALRYALMSLFVLGAQHHLDEVWIPEADDGSELSLPEAGYFTTGKMF
jgi:hypothetical protein